MSTTPGERKALLFLGAVAALGAGMKLVGSNSASPVTPSSIEALQRQIEASESAGAASRGGRSGGRRSGARAAEAGSAPGSGVALPYDAAIRPLTDAELRGVRLAPPPDPDRRTRRSPAAGASTTVNVNTATAAELQVLPGIGPALADRIVRHRAEVGPFAGLADLDRVRGIGPAMLERIGPLVTF